MTDMIDDLHADGFDADALAIHRSAHAVAHIMMVAAYVGEAARAEGYARAALAGYDRELAPLMKQLRARLARPNPFAEPSRSCGDRP